MLLDKGKYHSVFFIKYLNVDNVTFVDNIQKMQYLHTRPGWKPDISNVDIMAHFCLAKTV